MQRSAGGIQGGSTWTLRRAGDRFRTDNTSYRDESDALGRVCFTIVHVTSTAPLREGGLRPSGRQLPPMRT